MSSDTIDTTYSDLALMIGGQILFLFLLVMLTVFGVKPISDPLSALFPTASPAASSASAASAPPAVSKNK